MIIVIQKSLKHLKMNQCYVTLKHLSSLHVNTNTYYSVHIINTIAASIDEKKMKTRKSTYPLPGRMTSP